MKKVIVFIVAAALFFAMITSRIGCKFPPRGNASIVQPTASAAK